VGRPAKIVLLAIVLTAFVLLMVLGFAVWVFIPLLPVAILFVISVLWARERAAIAKQKKETDTKTDSRKAA